MPRTKVLLSPKRAGIYASALLAASLLVMSRPGTTQDVPLISGGVGFVTSTNAGNTTYIPVISPLLAAPLGNHILVESRATILDSYFPKGGGHSGYTSSSFLGLSYLQMDYIASSHLTVVAGEFLTPFGTYNERLSPIWISNFESAPLIFNLGTMNTGSSVGGMLRGSAISNDHVWLDYAGYFSAASTNEQFKSQRASGARTSLYFPQARLEVGGSYGRLLEETHENFEGLHLWWQPADALVKLRSEFAHGPHSKGYWVESEFHLASASSGMTLRRAIQPVFRWQQTFRSSPDPTDGLPGADTKRADFGLDILFPHEVRINSSYSRQSSTQDTNIWQTGIVYRFLFPTWRGK
ncbi:hypothetical protein [Occallatibacter savannae]|uniref:hypothetical protein n=1 Tax=Occallatibacter savannae TaxID=1002691 RepID=UPI001EF73BCE|nr:hypothetical protein [Occallatibacter savannae]